MWERIVFQQLESQDFFFIREETLLFETIDYFCPIFGGGGAKNA